MITSMLERTKSHLKKLEIEICIKCYMEKINLDQKLITMLQTIALIDQDQLEQPTHIVSLQLMDNPNTFNKNMVANKGLTNLTDL